MSFNNDTADFNNCSALPWAVVISDPMFALEATSVALGLFAMLTNAMALRLFCRRRRRTLNRNGFNGSGSYHRSYSLSCSPSSPAQCVSQTRLSRTLRHLLLLLCLAETGFTASFCVHTVLFNLLYSRPLPSLVVLRAIFTCSVVFYFVANVCLPVRNWCVLLIAVSRFEVVAKPFARQQGKRCTSRRLVGALIVILVLSTGLTVPRLFDEQWTTCQVLPPDRGVMFRRLPSEPRLQALLWSLYVVYFTVQSLVPPLAVVLLSTGMILCLRRRHRASALTRALLGLLLIFGLLETVQFVLAAECIDGVDRGNCQVKAAAGNLLVVLDSCANFFVYMCTTAEVRAYTSSVLLRRRSSAVPNLEPRASISCSSLRPRLSSCPSVTARDRMFQQQQQRAQSTPPPPGRAVQPPTDEAASDRG